MKLHPAPGIFAIEPLDDTSSSTLTLTNKSESHLLKGKVIARGPDLITDGNACLVNTQYGRVGDTVLFLSYEGDYDNALIDNKKIYFVKVQDLRSTL